VNPPADAAQSVPSSATSPAAGQPADTAGAAATAPAAASAPATAQTSAGTNANASVSQLAPGLPVKDNTGATIGQIASLQNDASGKQMAVIKMGADSFSVTAANLAVDNGAATINLTQAQITDRLHKKQ
jgi:hypothetical protein